MNTTKVNYSYYTLRFTIGVLGIALPILLLIGNMGLETSISYYYYTKMSTVFTGILIAFALVLVTYRGDTQITNWRSENALTHIAGFFALMVALVPTQHDGPIDQLYYVHDDCLRGWIHNISAVLFIFFVGLVVLLYFARAAYFRTFYKWMGGLTMFFLGLTILAFILKEHVFKGAVFVGETLALWAFGAAWLRRGIKKT